MGDNKVASRFPGDSRTIEETGCTRGLRVKPLWLMNVLLQPGSVLTLCPTIESLLVSSLRVGSIMSILGMKKGRGKGWLHTKWT